MSFGKMNTLIRILNVTKVKDADGFSQECEQEVLQIKAYKEERHASKKWANMAAFSKANATFTFRKHPKIEVDKGMIVVCDGSRYRIISTERIGRMYIEVATEKIEPF